MSLKRTVGLLVVAIVLGVCLAIVTSLILGCSPSEATRRAKDEVDVATMSYAEALADPSSSELDIKAARDRLEFAVREWTESAQRDILRNPWIDVARELLIVGLGGAGLWKLRNLTRARDLRAIATGPPVG